jgi:ABC-2 type transport system ATP-binding protein
MPGVTPPGTRWLQVPTTEPASVLERMRNRSGVREATIFGQAVHALVDVDRKPEELGLQGMEVLAAEPSLEDVFVTLARHER